MEATALDHHLTDGQRELLEATCALARETLASLGGC